MTLRDDETVRIYVGGDASAITDHVDGVVDGLNGAMAAAGTLTPDDRAEWADQWLQRQGDKPAWAWSILPDGLTREDIAAAQTRKLHGDHPDQIGSIRCDTHGRAACPSCHRPLHVAEYAETLKLLQEHQGTIELLDAVVIFCLGFVACGLIVFILWIAGLLRLGGAL